MLRECLCKASVSCSTSFVQAEQYRALSVPVTICSTAWVRTVEVALGSQIQGGDPVCMVPKHDPVRCDQRGTERDASLLAQQARAPCSPMGAGEKLEGTHWRHFVGHGCCSEPGFTLPGTMAVALRSLYRAGKIVNSNAPPPLLCPPPATCRSSEEPLPSQCKHTTPRPAQTLHSKAMRRSLPSSQEASPAKRPRSVAGERSRAALRQTCLAICQPRGRQLACSSSKAVRLARPSRCSNTRPLSLGPHTTDEAGSIDEIWLSAALQLCCEQGTSQTGCFPGMAWEAMKPGCQKRLAPARPSVHYQKLSSPCTTHRLAQASMQPPMRQASWKRDAPMMSAPSLQSGETSTPSALLLCCHPCLA